MPDQERTARIFNRLMLQGKVNAALRLLSRDDNGGVLSLDDLIPTGIGQNGEVVQQTTHDTLMEKENRHQTMHYYRHKLNQTLP